LRRFLLAALLTLTACGGGNSSDSPSVAPTPAPAPRVIDFTFFGPSDIASTALFTSAYFAIDWGPENAKEDIKLRMIAEMQAARARGVDKFILGTGFLQFDAQCNYQGNAALAAFKLQLDALDLSRSVWMLYPRDEPDINCNANDVARAYADGKALFPGVRIGVIYADSGRTPGIDQATDVGRDKYGHGPQVLSLRADQHLMLVAGGADPYREDIQQYVDYAEANTNVSLVWAFLYVDYTGVDGKPAKGIGTNGMLPSYRAAGCKLTMKCSG
jgi:hypothetical protein